jgi:hypothetical protein
MAIGALQPRKFGFDGVTVAKREAGIPGRWRDINGLTIRVRVGQFLSEPFDVERHA